MVEMLVELGLPVHLAKRYSLSSLCLLLQFNPSLEYLLPPEHERNCQKNSEVKNGAFINLFTRINAVGLACVLAGSTRKFARALRCTTSGARPSQRDASTSAKDAPRCPATALKLAPPRVWRTRQAVLLWPLKQNLRLGPAAPRPGRVLRSLRAATRRLLARRR